MLATLDPRHLERVWFPLGDQIKGDTRAEAAQAGLAVADRADSQEACFLAGDDYRSFLSRQGLAQRARRDRRRDGHDGRQRTTGSGGSHRVSAAGSASRRREPLYALSTDRPHEHRRRRTARRPSREPASRPAAGSSRLSRGSSAKLRYRSPAVAATVEPTGERASGCASTSRRTASPADRPRCSTTVTSSSAPVWSPRPDATRLSPVVLAFSFGDLADLALAIFLIAVGSGSAGRFCGSP